MEHLISDTYKWMIHWGEILKKKEKTDIKSSEKNDLDKKNSVVAEQENRENVVAESVESTVFTAEQIIEMQKEMLNLQIKLKDSDEKLLRSHAEFENFRKRGIRERNDIRKNTQLDTISTILPVLDHFELALNAAEDAQNVNAVLDGMKLIKAEFEKALISLGVDTINATGETFNPEIHEAIANEASEEHEKDTVIKQWRAGYKLGDRLIRPATVVVSSGSEAKEKSKQ